mmetsp:Transcript_3750/g.6632  ORF Transcript_3750/g.6632 Transcript_3750/m.6632 type:complete len:342 (-) Transcript_3750:1825-2850(-)
MLLHALGEQVGIGAIVGCRIRIRRLYIDVMPHLLPNGLLRLCLLLLVLWDCVMSLVLLVLLVMVTSTSTISSVVRRGSWMGRHAIKVILTPSATRMVGVVVVRTPPCQHLIQVIILECLALQHKVGKPPTNLAQNPASSCSIPNPPSILRRQMRLHRLHQANRLRVRTHAQRSLNDIIPKRIHHQLSYAICLVQLIEVCLPHPVCAPFQTLLHYIRRELLDGEEAHLADNRFANGVDLVVAADVEDILDDVVAVGVLHKLEGLLNDTTHQVGPSGGVAGVETALDHAAPVAVASDVLDTGGDRIEDKLGVLVWKFEQNALDRVVAMRVDAQSCSGGLERVR